MIRCGTQLCHIGVCLGDLQPFGWNWHALGKLVINVVKYVKAALSRPLRPDREDRRR
jgi:hypothetical protein